MRCAVPIVEVQVAQQCASGMADAVVGMQIDLLVLERLPQPLDEHVVAPATLAIHADGDLPLVFHPAAT